MTARVKEILSWYGSDNPGTLTNLACLLNHPGCSPAGLCEHWFYDLSWLYASPRNVRSNPRLR